MRARVFLKFALVVVLVAGLAVLFLRTVHDTLAEPYVVRGAVLSGWTLAIEEPGGPAAAMVALRPPPRLTRELFRQIFQRTMVSMTTPAQPAMPVVLQGEYAESLQSVMLADEILALARKAGLERERFEPVCLASRQESAGGRSSQLYFAVFEASAVGAFREQLAALHRERGGSGRFEPEALAPLLPVASSDADFARWWPLELDPGRDCQAPLLVDS
jgi:hypothetical protein